MSGLMIDYDKLTGVKFTHELEQSVDEELSDKELSDLLINISISEQELSNCKTIHDIECIIKEKTPGYQDLLDYTRGSLSEYASLNTALSNFMSLRRRRIAQGKIKVKKKDISILKWILERNHSHIRSIQLKLHWYETFYERKVHEIITAHKQFKDIMIVDPMELAEFMNQESTKLISDFQESFESPYTHPNDIRDKGMCLSDGVNDDLLLISEKDINNIFLENIKGSSLPEVYADDFTVLSRHDKWSKSNE